MAYKKNVDDTRESPGFEILDRLQKKGAHVSYSDPHVRQLPMKRDYQLDLNSVRLTPDTLTNTDCVILVTDHDAFDYAMIQKHSPLVVDTRGVYRDLAPNVISA